MPAEPGLHPWRKYLRFSVRGLIVFVLVIGAGLGWIEVDPIVETKIPRSFASPSSCGPHVPETAAFGRPSCRLHPLTPQRKGPESGWAS